jgi:hypothetical protein
MIATRFVARLALGTAFVLVVTAPRPASAQETKRIGGHIGFVVPLVSRMDGTTTTVADDFVIGFPTGFGLKRWGRVALDLELVPGYQNAPSDVSLEIHPGVVFDVRENLAAGMRVAFDAEGDAWGFTPLVNRTLYNARTHSLFGEVVLPVRFVDHVGGNRTSVGLGVHVGIGF